MCQVPLFNIYAEWNFSLFSITALGVKFESFILAYGTLHPSQKKWEKLRALRGYFGPHMNPKNESCFSQFFRVALLEQ